MRHSASAARAVFFIFSLTVGWGAGGPVAASSAAVSDRYPVLAERNIFDAERHEPRPPERRSTAPRTEPAQHMTLIGVALTGSEAYAHFMGPDPGQHRVVPVGGSIGGLVVVRITPTAVVLGTGTVERHVPVGSRLRREGRGEWRLAHAAAADAPVDAPAVPVESSARNELIRRLMERRQRELSR